MRRPVHPSYGRVKQNVDGWLFGSPVICLDGQWTGKKKKFKSYVSWSSVLRTAQTALDVMLLSYYIGICVFHERQCDICRRRAYSQGFAKAVHMSYDRQHFDPA